MMRIDVIKCECDVMLSVHDVICMPRLMISILVVMSSIQQVDDTDTVAVMSNIVGEMTGIVIVLS